MNGTCREDRHPNRSRNENVAVKAKKTRRRFVYARQASGVFYLFFTLLLNKSDHVKMMFFSIFFLD